MVFAAFLRVLSGLRVRPARWKRDVGDRRTAHGEGVSFCCRATSGSGTSDSERQLEHPAQGGRHTECACDTGASFRLWTCFCRGSRDPAGSFLRSQARMGPCSAGKTTPLPLVCPCAVAESGKSLGGIDEPRHRERPENQQRDEVHADDFADKKNQRYGENSKHQSDFRGHGVNRRGGR